MPYDLRTLINATDPRLFASVAGDNEETITLSITDYKEMALAINVVSERFSSLRTDLERALARIEVLEERTTVTERHLNAFSSAVCACTAGEE